MKDRFNTCIATNKESLVVVARNGKPVGMINFIEDDLDSLLLVRKPRFIHLLAEARQRVWATGILRDKFRRCLVTA